MRQTRTHGTGDCEVIRRTGTLCPSPAKVVMVRADGSTLPMCTRHSNQLRETMEKHPGAFNPVEWKLAR